MSEQMEGLVEEIYNALSRFAGHTVRYQANGNRHAAHECKMAHVHAFISRIGKAYADGELKLPGEHWRGPLVAYEDGGFAAMMRGEHYHDSIKFLVIALRKEEEK